MIKKLLIASILLVLSTFAFTACAFAAEQPDALVKRTYEDVLAVVKTDKDIQAGNTDKLLALAQEKIAPNFNFEKVCRLVLGKNWTKATADQKTAFQEEFRTLMIRTYASALSKFKNQTIEYAPFKMADGAATATVKSTIVQPGGPPIAVNYALEKQADAWKVYDIVIEGVSLVTNYRSQFAQEIRQNGLDSLIKKLADKNATAKIK